MTKSTPHRRFAAQNSGSILLEATRPARPGDPPARSLLFTAPEKTLVARTLRDLPEFFAELESARARGLWAAGYLSYECGYHWEPSAAPPGWSPSENALPLATFGLYRAPLDPAMLPVDPDEPQSDAALPATLPLAASETRFTQQVQAIRQLIEAGDTYQANLTTQVHVPFSGSPAALFTQMLTAQPVEFGALLHLHPGVHILSASPELFFRIHDDVIEVRPMKGTAPRGRTAAEDAQQSAWLAADPKNRAENLMIVDLLRNDLGRIAETGSVEVGSLFDVDQFPTLLQMTSRIRARLRPETDAYSIFRALFPSGSIVGAPKIRTMQILRTLEARDREVYTGAIGYFAPNGDAIFSVAIRTAVLREGSFSMGVGAGITYDSDPASEYRECLLKAAFLQQEPFSLIESMRWDATGCPLLPLHLQRLSASAGYFGFPCDPAQITMAISDHVRHLSTQAETAWKLRLLLHADGSFAFSSPELLPCHSETPERIALAAQPVHSGERFLAHKTTRRALYDTTLRRAREQGFADVLFVNEHNHVTECTISNILVRHGDRWRTPSISSGVLPGVFRAHLLATMPGLVEADIPFDELATADEIRLTNAVRGMRLAEFVPVRLSL